MKRARLLLPQTILLAALAQPASGAIAGEAQASASAACEAPAARIAIGSEVRAEIQATSAPYPATARYYCIAVPAGRASLTIELDGMTTDLDLYAGYGTLRSVQGVDISAGQHYEWKSNAFGTATESVTIPNPRPGVYYVEIVSYQGSYSPYRLTVR